MIFYYYIILLFLSWPQARCIGNARLKEDEIFDQLAIASEDAMNAVRQSISNLRDLREFSNVPSPVSEAVHYENSNGFVPMIPSVTPSYNDPVSSSLRANDYEQRDERFEENNATNSVSAEENSGAKLKKFEEDLAYSSDARIFLNFPGSLTNRRSFDLQDKPSEFELLKVNNDTPAVANYQDFYDNVRTTVNTEIDSKPDAHSLGRLSTGRGKKIENYIRVHDRQLQKTNDKSPQYYNTYNIAHDAKKITHEAGKVSDNYRQQDTANYNGHGQSATKQSAATLSSLSRTNYEVNGLVHNDSHRAAYDNLAESLKSNYKFTKPVVVAEPSNYKVDVKYSSQISSDDLVNDKISRNIESSSVEAHNDNSKQRSYHTKDSTNLSNESSEYSEYAERPRRLRKNRRRPAYSDSSRKLPKEHRGPLMNDSTEERNKHQYSVSKVKPQRYRTKANPWTNDASVNHQDGSFEDVRYDTRNHGTETKSSKIHHGSRPKTVNEWNHVSPSLEISQSHEIELDQIEKPKYVVPIKLNLLPVANVNHATALSNGQGFDTSNAVLQNFVTAAPIGAYNTNAPLLSTPQSIFAQNLALSKNLPNLGISTPLPDIIVGQNTFQNPMVLFSGGQNKVANTLRSTYLPSTMASIFAVTPSLQNIPTTPTAVVQHIPMNQMHPGLQQFIMPQPTVQTLSGFLQTPLQTNSEYQIQVNPYGLHGQSSVNQGNLLQIQSSSTTPAIPQGRSKTESQNKKNVYPASDTNFLASASLTVSQDEQRQATDANSYYLQNHSTQRTVKPQEGTYRNKNTDLQDTSAILQRPRDQIQQYNRVQSNIANNAQTSVDNAGSHSNSVNAFGVLSTNAHLPNVGTKNVEIVNPNIKPSPIDATANTFDSMHYPAAVLTTPIPIFSTIAPVTQVIPQAVSLQSYVNALTESGAKAKQLNPLDYRQHPLSERPMFNPINFVPNVDVIKNQNALNNKIPSNEPIQQGLNLVPLMPGGNFFKPSFAAQHELIMKPRLASDLQKYAEEMFKESLKTMYNSQKWNNDRKPQESGIILSQNNNSDTNDLANLKIELQKLKASLSDNSKYKDILEAHQSEHKLHTTDFRPSSSSLSSSSSSGSSSSSSSKNKPSPLLTTLEQLLKNRPSGSIHIYHDNRPSRPHRHSGDSNYGYGFRDDFRNKDPVMEFLTPPRPHSFRSKGHPHEKPMKKRPSRVSRYKNRLRKPMRPINSKSNRLESSASNVDGSYYHKSPYDRANVDFDFKHQSSFDTYPTFTTSAPTDTFNNALRELRASNNKDYDINHPRMHNLLGLLMKNKQLPKGVQNYLRDKNQLRQFLGNEKRQLQQQFYDDALNDYFLDKFEGATQSGSIARNAYSGNGAA